MSHPLKDLIQNKDLFESLADQFGTPLYIYSKQRLVHNITRIKSSLSNYFDSYHICYTIKANSNPHLIKLLKSTFASLGADCSSPGELYIANQSDIKSDECIYNGNYESKNDLEIAKNHFYPGHVFLCFWSQKTFLSRRCILTIWEPKTIFIQVENGG